MVAGSRRIIIVVVLVALLSIVGAVAVLALQEASLKGQVSSVSSSTQTKITLIGLGTTQTLIPRGGVPVCYNVAFNLTGTRMLSGGLSATGLINWYILSTSGGPPLTGTIVSGTITQTLPSGQYVLEFCNQQKSSSNFTITQPFVVTKA